jgi:subtilisin-like proprotein convertase family protein
VLAQEQESPAQRQEQPLVNVQRNESIAQQQTTGISAKTTESVVVNFSTLASREALAPAPYKEPKVIREPGPAPRHKTVSVEDGAVLEEERPGIAYAPPEPLAPSPAASSSFKALEDNNTVIPPDTHGAVGPNHLMVVHNTQIRIQTRAGATISTVSLDSFWSTVPGPWAFGGGPNTFDPKVLYDPYNNRWMFTVTADAAETTSAVLIAVSLTSDPTGNWRLFRADADWSNSTWADYPSIGFNKNWIVVTVNMFELPPYQSFTGTHIYVFNKDSLYNSSTGSYTEFSDPLGATMAPAITYDNTLETMYLVEDYDGHRQLRLSSLTGTPASPAYTPSNIYPTAPEAGAWKSYPPGRSDFAPQLGSTRMIQTNDSRIQNVVYRNGSLWFAHTIFLPGSGTPTYSAVQWWELDPSGAIKQRGRVEDAAGQMFYAFPSIAVNKNNDVLIGYSRFSSQQYASANYSFRAGTDPVNTLRADAILKAGSAPYDKDFGSGRNRWGDYSSTVVDPLNDLDMWTIQEHSAPTSGGYTRWGTWWGRIGPATQVPLIQRGTVTATDGGTDPDTLIEPGENDNKLSVQLKNTGNGAATAISGKLTTSTAGVTITTDTSAYPNLAATTGVGTNTTPFAFNVASTVPCGQFISFTLTITYTGGGGPTVFVFTIPTGKAGVAVTKPRTGEAVAIPDKTSAGVNIPLVVSGFTGRISDLNFKFGGTACSTTAGSTTVGLDHTWVGDLVMTLTSPQGTVVTLMNQPGGDFNEGHNFCNTLLDDESAGISIQSVTTAQAPYVGSFKPNTPLSAFDGENPNGTWTLNVSDRAELDTGSVRAFSLIITPYECSMTDVLIQLGTVTATDGGSDPDTLIEPGENGNKLTIQLKNTGNGAATSVSAKLTSATPGVTITTNVSTYPNLAATTGVGTNTTPFAFNVASTVPCGQFITFTLTVTYTGGGSPRTFSFIVPTGKADVAVTRPRTGEAVAIPDNNVTGVNIPLVVSGFTGRISDLNFKFDGTACSTAVGATTVGLDHAWVSNLVVTLKSPQGTSVTIMNRPGGVNNSGHNFCNTMLDDESAGASIQTITTAQAPFTGSFKPNIPLSAFDGQDPNGTWTLNVSDRSAANTGSLRAFSLIITPYACSTTALATPFEVHSGKELASTPSAGGVSAMPLSWVSTNLFPLSEIFCISCVAPQESDVGCFAALTDRSLNLTAFLAGINQTPVQIGDETLRSAFMQKR